MFTPDYSKGLLGVSDVGTRSFTWNRRAGDNHRAARPHGVSPDLVLNPSSGEKENLLATTEPRGWCAPSSGEARKAAERKNHSLELSRSLPTFAFLTRCLYLARSLQLLLSPRYSETKDEQQKADQTIWDRRSCERGSGRHVLRQLEVGSSCGRKIDFCGSGIGRARLRGSGRHNRRSNDYRKLRTSSRRQTRRSGIGGPGNVAPGDTAFGSSRLEVLVGSCEDMDIGVLKKEELLLLAVELSLDINSRLRKPEIRSAIIEGGFEEDELSEAWEKICDPTVGHPRVESFGGGGVCCVPLPVTSSRRARCRRHSVPRTQRLLRLTIVSRDGALAPRLGPAECGGGFGERKIRRCFLEGWVHPEQLSIELRGSRVPGGRFTPLIPPSYCGPPLPFVKWTDGPR
ncbi:hypothetical protein HPB51_029640 [Rhipicephalus microplus]|uniref:Uncharacterized protein n=1 Tax=Rhipicephalus microplus TaxID=6941 RepID=A0A9J6CUB8_RHIMP|nr:hypothetical protein HPB51_029640 [Rhipicephalus microplus]